MYIRPPNACQESGWPALILAAVILLAACGDPDALGPAGPALASGAPQDPSRGVALDPFPELLETLPAVRIADAPDTRPEAPDAELVEGIARAGGRVMIGLKPAAARRNRETGVVAAIDRATALAARATIESLGVQITMTYRHTSAVAATIAPELAPRLRRLEVVDYVEPSFPAYVQALQDTSWGVHKVFAPYVWAGTYGTSTRGEWVFVTILDTGVDESHATQWWGDGPEGMGPFGDCLYVQETGSSCYDDLTVADIRGHGAHVAGIIAAKNNDSGYVGVAWNPGRFASVKVCDSAGKCEPEWITAGLDWVLGQSHPRRIVNISLGRCDHHPALAQLVATAASAGILIVASAGNIKPGAPKSFYCGQSGDDDLPDWQTSVMFPARYPEVMAVSGTWGDDSFAVAPEPSGGGGPPPPPPCEGEGCPEEGGPCTNGSRYGSEVEVAAPFSAASMSHSGGYDVRCGTSMSAPLVSGVAALVWSHNLNWTASQVRNRLKSTAVPRSPATQFGSGRVNALHAVHGIPAPPPPPPPLTASLSGPGEVQPYATCLYQAIAQGGTPPYSYAWTADGVPVGGNDAFYYHTVGASDFQLAVRVTDAQATAVWDLLPVTVSAWAAECLDM